MPTPNPTSRIYDALAILSSALTPPPRFPPPLPPLFSPNPFLHLCWLPELFSCRCAALRWLFLALTDKATLQGEWSYLQPRT